MEVLEKTSETFTEGFIGMVLKFNEAEYLALIRRAERSIFPAIEKVSTEYKPIAEETLTHEAFLDLLEHGVKNLHKKLDAVVMEDLKKMKTKFILESSLQYIEERLKPLEKAVSNLHNAMYSSRSSISYQDLSWDDFLIIDGLPTINREALRDRCEIRIDTEDKLTLFNHYQALKKEYNNLREFLVSKGFNTSRSSIIANDARGLMYEDFNCNLIIPEDSIDLRILRQ